MGVTAQDQQSREEFEAWYIAQARKSVPALKDWSDDEVRDGLMRPRRNGEYRIDSAQSAWEAWQAARALPAVDKSPDMQGKPVDKAAILQGPAPADQWKCGRELLPYHPSASHVEPAYRDGWNHCYAAAQALMPGNATSNSAPVELPEPETWAIYDSRGLYETRDTEAECKSFCDHYNARDKKLGGGLAPYTYKALHAADTVRRLLEGKR